MGWILNTITNDIYTDNTVQDNIHICFEAPFPKPMWYVSENPNDVKTASTKDFHTPCFDIPFPSPLWYTDGTDVSHGGAKDYIEMGAFKGAINLTEIKIPQSVKRIGPEAFAGTGLTSVTIA